MEWRPSVPAQDASQTSQLVATPFRTSSLASPAWMAKTSRLSALSFMTLTSEGGAEIPEEWEIRWLVVFK